MRPTYPTICGYVEQNSGRLSAPAPGAGPGAGSGAGPGVGAGARQGSLGREVQVDPLKPKLKAPGTACLKLPRDKLLSSFSFKFDLHRYT